MTQENNLSNKIYKLLPHLALSIIIISFFYIASIPFIIPNANREMIHPYSFTGNIDILFEDGTTEHATAPHAIKTDQSFDIVLNLKGIGMIDNKTLSFMSKDILVRCEVDDKIIFRNTNIRTHSNFDDGNILYLIDLPERIYGDTIILHYENDKNYTTTFEIKNIKIGYRTNILAYYFLSGNLINLILMLFMLLLVISIFLTGISFKNKTKTEKYFTYISLLCLGMILYVLSMSPLSYFVLHKLNVFLHIISYTCVLLLPVVLIKAILLRIDNASTIFFKIGIALASLNTIAQYIIIFAKRGTFNTLSNYSYAVLLYTAIICLLAFYKNRKTKDPNTKSMIAQLTPLLVAIIIDIINSYLSKTLTMSIFFKLSLLAFVILQSSEFLRMYINQRDKEIESQLYKRLAFIDTLTGLGNRLAFSESTKFLSKEDSELYVIVMDVDNLKYINDTYGHKYGDAIITLLANTLKEHFKNNAELFRVGGDEFIIFYHVPKCDKILDKLNTISSKYSSACIENNIHDFGVSFGYDYYDHKINTLEEVIHNADQSMYTHKSKKSKSY